VVGHRPQGALARWFGSVGSYLVKRLRCSVLVAQTEISDDEFEQLSCRPKRRSRVRSDAVPELLASAGAQAGTMILPIGHSAMPASFRWAQAKECR